MQVLTTAPGPFPTGARLIAGETALAEGDTHAARFDMYVETDEEGADAFPPALPSMQVLTTAPSLPHRYVETDEEGADAFPPALPSMQVLTTAPSLPHRYVETDEEGADAFERTPCLLFTLQGGDTGLRATCTEVSAAGFSRALDCV